MKQRKFFPHSSRRLLLGGAIWAFAASCFPSQADHTRGDAEQALSPDPDLRPTTCSPEEEVVYHEQYSMSSVHCLASSLSRIDGTDSLAIRYTVDDEDSFDPNEDPYAGFWELLRYRNGRLMERIPAPGGINDYIGQRHAFVRVREQKFVADRMTTDTWSSPCSLGIRAALFG